MFGHIDQFFQVYSVCCKADHVTEEISNEQCTRQVAERNQHQVLDHFPERNLLRYESQRYGHHIACQQFPTGQQHQNKPYREDGSPDKVSDGAPFLRSTGNDANIQ
ncbi:hypothetical protein D3C73_1431540 [compost metagenome]